MPEAWDPRTLPTAFWVLVVLVALYMAGAAWVARWTEKKQRELIPGLNQLEQEILATSATDHSEIFGTTPKDFAAAVERLKEMGLIK